MTETHINRPVIVAAVAGVVTGQAAKRGKVLLTVKLANGREMMVALKSVEFTDVERFAPPAPFSELVADYRRDNIRRRREMGIACAP